MLLLVSFRPGTGSVKGDQDILTTLGNKLQEPRALNNQMKYNASS